MPEGAEEGTRAQPAPSCPATGPALVRDGKVFISHASQDAAIADALVEALERQGIKCWIAPRDVDAGAFYADAIVRAIDAAPVLVLVLSTHAAASHHILREVERASAKRHPVMALRIDQAPLPAALEYFLNTSQWLDASGGDFHRSLAKLVESLRQASSSTANEAIGSTPSTEPPGKRRLVAVAVVSIVILILGVAIRGFWTRRPAGEAYRALPESTTNNNAAFNPPPHSIAVLPFVNMSGDPTQEYFSDGVTEELLNSLSRLNELQVVARTSSFSFKGQNVDVSTIAHKLNVGNVLEGSVRRAGDTVRITAQLINAVTGFHIWSQTYDRKFTDILKIQTEVATSVADRLKVTLAGDETAKLELGGTKNSEAYEAYLQGAELLSNWDFGEADLRAALKAFDRAIALDPNFALAYEKRALTLNDISIFAAQPSEIAQVRAQAVVSAERAVSLAPDLGEIHLTLADVYAYGLLDFVRAAPEFERALALSPGSARVQRGAAAFAGEQGHFQAAILAARRAVGLDPQNLDAYITLGQVLTWARDYPEALSVLHTAQLLRPDSLFVRANIANVLLASGAADQARSLCEGASMPRAHPIRQYCLALAYYQLGRQTEAEHQFQQFKADHPEAGVEIAGLYAQQGNIKSALLELARAERQRDSALQVLRVSWTLDPIRGEPEFKALLTRMNFQP